MMCFGALALPRIVLAVGTSRGGLRSPAVPVSAGARCGVPKRAEASPLLPAPRHPAQAGAAPWGPRQRGGASPTPPPAGSGAARQGLRPWRRSARRDTESEP